MTRRIFRLGLSGGDAVWNAKHPKPRPSTVQMASIEEQMDMLALHGDEILRRHREMDLRQTLGLDPGGLLPLQSLTPERQNFVLPMSWRNSISNAPW